MAATPGSTARCSDPMKNGCTNTVTPGFALPRSPHITSAVPCQKCKYHMRVRDREARGLPPTRSGAGTKDRL
jgi:hypothetical protein